MKIQTVGAKPQNLTRLIRSTESTLTIKKGAPVALDFSASKNGWGCKSVVSLAAAEEGFFFGLASADIIPGAFGETVYGYIAQARVVITSRSATSAAWVSVPAIALGDILNIVTATDAISGVQALSRSAAGSAITSPAVLIAAETVASATTLSSTLSGSLGGPASAALYSIAYKKVRVAIL